MLPMALVPRGFLPSTEALAGWETVKQAVEWADIDQVLWAAIAKELGDEQLDNLVLLASMDPSDIKAAVERTTPAPIVRAKAKLLYTAVRLRCGAEPLDCMSKPKATLPQPLPEGAGKGGGGILGKPPAVLKLKVSTVLDQSSDREVEDLDAGTLAGFRKTYRLREGDNPLECEEVTDAQLSALEQVVRAGGVPYADFGVWGPYGNRIAKAQRFADHYMDSEGRMRLREMRGPPDVAAWEKSWRVFRTAAVMTGLATAAALDVYAAKFEQRVERHPNSWSTALLADQRCRSEWWEHEHRRQQDFHLMSPNLSGFNPDTPWNSVIKESAVTFEFWHGELERPALMAAVGGRRSAGGSRTARAQGALAGARSRSPNRRKRTSGAGADESLCAPPDADFCRKCAGLAEEAGTRAEVATARGTRGGVCLGSQPLPASVGLSGKSDAYSAGGRLRPPMLWQRAVAKQGKPWHARARMTRAFSEASL